MPLLLILGVIVPLRKTVILCVIGMQYNAIAQFEVNGTN